MMSVPFQMMNQDLRLRTRWRKRSRSFGCGFVDYDPACRPPCGFLGLILRSRVGSCFPLADSSLSGTNTGSGRRATHGLITRRLGQNRDGHNWDVTIEARNGRDEAAQGLHSETRDVRFKENEERLY
jgi:hypothetical protein